MQTPRNPFISMACLVAAAVFLSACTTLGTPVSSMVKLSRLSPLDSDPADFRIALRTPAFMRLQDGDITLTMRFDTGDTRTSLIEQFAPVINAGAAAPGIDRAGFGTDTLTVAYLDDNDAMRLKAAQQRIKAMRANGIVGKGSLSLAATGCATAPLPDGPVRISGWLSSTPEPEFYILMYQIDIRKTLAQAGGRPLDLGPC